MTIAKLFARIGLKADQEKADKFLTSVKGIKIGLVAAATGAVAFSAAIKKITDEAFNGAAAFKQFEAETGQSAETLQKWQAVANQTNNSAEAVTSSIKALVANQEKIKLGQGNISGFQLLGIDPRQNPFEILEELREKTDGLSQGMKKNALAQMGISADLIQVLELTNNEFDRMAASAFIIPSSAIAQLDKARASGQMLANAVKYLKNMIAANLAPAIDKINKSIALWIKQNQDGIIKTVKTIFGWITRFATAIGRTVSMINEAVTGTIGWGNALKILIAVFAILNAQLLISPLGLIIAGIILLVAVLDDLYVYSKGEGESLFGNMMEQFPRLEAAILGFWEKIKEVGAVLKAIFTGDTTGIEEILESWGIWGDIIQGIVDGMQAIKDFLSGESFNEWAFGAEDELGQRTQTTGFNRMFGSGGNSNVTTNNNNITINTNADGEGTVDAAKEWQSQLNIANSAKDGTE